MLIEVLESGDRNRVFLKNNETIIYYLLSIIEFIILNLLFKLLSNLLFYACCWRLNTRKMKRTQHRSSNFVIYKMFLLKILDHDVRLQ